ncbi:hypothetical protein BGZ82_003174, partial [Podila clonocystis]
TKKLRGLYLGAPEGTTAFSFSTSTASPLSIRTWDWDLPFLVCLHLTVEFSLGFQFRMLQGIPALRELCQSIISLMSRHERVLTEADFLVEPSLSRANSQDGNDDNDQNSADSIQEPTKLLHLHSEANLYVVYQYLLYVKLELKLDGPRSQPRMGGGNYGTREHLLESSYLSRMKMRRQLMDYEFQFHEGHHGVLSKENSETQGQRENMVSSIEAVVKQHAVLKPRLEAVLGQIQEVELKKRQEQMTQIQLQEAHPNWLFVPSLWRLEIHGGWQMQSATSTRLADLDVLEGECKLREYEQQAISPFEVDTRAT